MAVKTSSGMGQPHPRLMLARPCVLDTHPKVTRESGLKSLTPLTSMGHDGDRC